MVGEERYIVAVENHLLIGRVLDKTFVALNTVGDWSRKTYLIVKLEPVKTVQSF